MTEKLSGGKLKGATEFEDSREKEQCQRAVDRDLRRLPVFYMTNRVKLGKVNESVGSLTIELCFQYLNPG